MPTTSRASFTSPTSDAVVERRASTARLPARRRPSSAPGFPRRLDDLARLTVSPTRALHVIKTFHTLVWALIASCILVLPVLGWLRCFGWAALATSVVLVECLVLAFHHGRCPLTGVAESLTADRSDNVDIYLPLWLARYNQWIFGALFLAGGVVVLVSWFLRP